MDGRADGATPGIGTEGLGVLVFGEAKGLHHDLGEIGEGASGSGRDMAAGGGGEESSEGGVEIASGKIITGEDNGDLAAELVGGVGLLEFASVKTAK